VIGDTNVGVAVYCCEKQRSAVFSIKGVDINAFFTKEQLNEEYVSLRKQENEVQISSSNFTNHLPLRQQPSITYIDALFITM
jgi:hypothetical protein